MKCNEVVRRATRTEGIPLYAVANEIGISEPTIHRWLRTPLSPEREARIMEAIRSLAEAENQQSEEVFQ